jgi:hypothetical protein
MLFDTLIFVPLSILDGAILLMIKHNFLFDFYFSYINLGSTLFHIANNHQIDIR